MPTDAGVPTICFSVAFGPARLHSASDAMKPAATSLSPPELAALTEFLQKEGITCQTRLSSAESGLDVSDLLVDDALYDRACELVENWFEMRGAEQTRKSTPHCPKCGAQSWEQVDDAHYAKVGLAVFCCTECGCLAPGR